MVITRWSQIMHALYVELAEQIATVQNVVHELISVFVKDTAKKSERNISSQLT